MCHANVERNYSEAGVITAVADKDTPPEFRKFDKPLGMEQHVHNRLIIITGHVCFFYYFLYLFPLGIVPRGTFIISYLYCTLAGIGITVGCHRYWTHRTYKATLPLQIILMLFQTAAYQFPIFKWCRDHRVHHKYTDTDADPHNANRGFWFSHIGWLLMPKHPEVEEKLKLIHISDLAADPVVRFQSKYFWPLALLMSLIVPVSICHWAYPEMSLFHLIVWNFSWYCITLNCTWLVNSVAHLWGDKPYDKYITASESPTVAFLAMGEGWHNYHHTFPWDYKTAELGYKFNISTVVIDLCAWLGLAYDLKTVSKTHLVERIKRTGDTSHETNKNKKFSDEQPGKKELDHEGGMCWGWGDSEVRIEDVDITEIVYPFQKKCD